MIKLNRHGLTQASCNSGFVLRTGIFLLLIFAGFNSSVCAIAQVTPSEKSSAPQASTPQIAAWWGFDEPAFAPSLSLVKTVGQPTPIAGPRSPNYTEFSDTNMGLSLDGASYLRFQDPGGDSLFDFGVGDSITLEAWIRPDFVSDGQQIYLIGKGRTGRQGFDANNQNWALRLRGNGSTALVSFLFRSQAMENQPSEFHRWNTLTGLVPDGQWHHVAVQFQFGNAKSIAAWIDGRKLAGTWDMGTDHGAAPVQDDDEIWIGSSMKGQASSTYQGDIDQILLHRGLVPSSVLEQRGRSPFAMPQLEPTDDEEIQHNVLVEIIEGLTQDRSWSSEPGEITQRFHWDHLALVDTPAKYSDRGIRIDRTHPFLVRLRARVTFPDQGTGLLRSKNAARIWIDGEKVAETAFMSRNASGHEPVPDLVPPKIAGMHPVPSGHQEVTFDLPVGLTGEHLVTIETIVGGNGLRPELGDLCFALQQEAGPFIVATPRAEDRFELSSEEWLRFETASLQKLRRLNQKFRQSRGQSEQHYWEERHAVATASIEQLAPLDPPITSASASPIDAWVEAALDKKGLSPADEIDDLAFLRRLYLDTLGVPPTLDDITAFLDEPDATRRKVWIDRVLNDARWADHWVSYWQDVLAENPGILKPELNNTGPFRYWIYESFLDNKPMDRFATELIRMEGSRLGGGPAGFAIASQNDVPMAAKGIVLTHAFLGVNMTCARCHDSPDRQSTQQDLFAIAALLDRRSIQLPKTSTVPARSDGTFPAVTVSLKPGENIEGNWPFTDASWSSLSEVPSRGRLTDPRERLAYWMTAPENQRFAQVIVNRLWARWMGRGIVEPVDDWEMGTATHPELLDWLGRELIREQYDLKHVARLILNSETYQRQAVEDVESIRWFVGPARRRLTAEQIVDSLYAVSGKSMGSELLTLDPEGRRPASTFLNLGIPSRAWNYVALSNERDRPALALPTAQGVIDLLVAFGWRESRPNPISTRDDSPLVLQPLVVANGNAAHRLTQFSEDSWFTQWSIEAASADLWLRNVFLRTLSRYPTQAELADLLPMIDPGFDERIVPGAAPRTVGSKFRNAVSWSNHLHPDATSIKMKLEAQARAGDLPTALLTTDWRERAEDVVWVLMNHPEFVYVP